MMTKKWVPVACALLMAGVLLCAPLLSASPLPRRPYADFLADLDGDGVAAVTLGSASTMAVERTDGATYETDNPRRESLKEDLLTQGIAVEESGGAAAQPRQMLGLLLAAALVAGAYRYFSRERAGTAVKQAAEAEKRLTFADVAGNAEAVASLRGLADYMKKPEKYTRLGARLPRGVLLYGPPGTGKTLMARALAGEAEVPFLYASGSDFVQMYVGMGASRIRELFKKARKHGKCLIFIDEIDALGRTRAGGDGGDSGERDQTLNALLTEMSGFEAGEGILVLAATNRRDTLDEALLRPGRFDRHIEVGLPDKEAREKILEVVSRRMPLTENCISDLARRTVGFSGAALESMMNEAAILAAQKGTKSVFPQQIETAYRMGIAGEERACLVDERDRRITAIHEAGHALAASILLPEDSIAHVTIIPSTRGSGGHMLRIPPERLPTRAALYASVMVALAGRAAEEIVLGADGVSVGAANDLAVATESLTRMICQLGMDEEAGLAVRDARQQGDRVAQRMGELYEEVVGVMRERREALEALAEALEARETLSGEEVAGVVAGTTTRASGGPLF